MSMIKMDSEKIAEVRNALTIIFSNAEMTSRKLCKAKFFMEKIEKEIFRIDRLLPNCQSAPGNLKSNLIRLKKIEKKEVSKQ